MSATERATTRTAPHTVAVLAQQRLVGQAVQMALRMRGRTALGLPWPVDAPQVRRVAVRVQGAGLGVALADLDNPVSLRQTMSLTSVAGVRWVVATSTPPGLRWGAVLASGATALLPITTHLEDLVEALDAVEDHRDVMDPEVRATSSTAWLDVAAEHADLTARLQTLSRREQAVLLRLYAGLSVREIAAESSVREATVRTQVKSVLRKLGVRSQIAAVAAYRRVALLE